MEISGQYLKYNDYLSLGGTLTEMPFKILEFKARKEIDKYTFNRLVNLENQVEEVKLCIYELIGLLNSYSTYENQNKSIFSESIDGYSTSYNTPSENTSKAQIKEIEDIIRNYLINCKLSDGTPYLYRGC